MGGVEEKVSTEFHIVKRYSELLTFHNLLKAEIKLYCKKKNLPGVEFPDFPPKKLLFNKDPQFLLKRVVLINQYFEHIFKIMPNKVPFTNAIIDLCLPFKLNVAVIGKNKSGKSSYIESVVKLLTEKAALNLIEN